MRGYEGPRQTILVVDDNEVQRDLVRELLEPLGFDVFERGERRECLPLVEQSSPNLILLDISMPDMDGWAVAQRLRRRPGKRPAILMLSANAMDTQRMSRPSGSTTTHDQADRPAADAGENSIRCSTSNGSTSRRRRRAAAAATPRRRDAGRPIGEIEELIQLGQIGHVRGSLPSWPRSKRTRRNAAIRRPDARHRECFDSSATGPHCRRNVALMRRGCQRHRTGRRRLAGDAAHADRRARGRRDDRAGRARGRARAFDRGEGHARRHSDGCGDAGHGRLRDLPLAQAEQDAGARARSSS